MLAGKSTIVTREYDTKTSKTGDKNISQKIENNKNQQQHVVQRDFMALRQASHPLILLLPANTARENQTTGVKWHLSQAAESTAQMSSNDWS